MLEVDTPEHLAFMVRIAGPARRSLAWMIDLFARTLLLVALYLLTSWIFSSVDVQGVGTGLMLFGLFVLDWGYFFAFEVLTGGRSIGKIFLKLRVVRTNGLPITWRESMLRNLLRAADLMAGPGVFLPLGPIVMAFDKNFRRLGDLAAGTVVVLEETTDVASKKGIAPDAGTVAELPAALPLDRKDLEALELFVHREHMSDARRTELAELVAGEYARRIGWPRPKRPTTFLASLWSRAQESRRGPTR